MVPEIMSAAFRCIQRFADSERLWRALLSVGSLAGLKFTVTLRDGSANPEFVIAAVTRSRASFTALLASPTIVHAGSPAATSTSTVTS
jgi:hypothetical protein